MLVFYHTDGAAGGPQESLEMPQFFPGHPGGLHQPHRAAKGTVEHPERDLA
jgi:hypothetical protein